MVIWKINILTVQYEPVGKVHLSFMHSFQLRDTSACNLWERRWWIFLKREVYRYPFSDSRDLHVNSREVKSTTTVTPAGHPSQKPPALWFAAHQRAPWVSLQRKTRPLRSLVFLWKVWHLQKSGENSRIWLGYIGLGYVISLRGMVNVLSGKKDF